MEHITAIKKIKSLKENNYIVDIWSWRQHQDHEITIKNCDHKYISWKLFPFFLSYFFFEIRFMYFLSSDSTEGKVKHF